MLIKDRVYGVVEVKEPVLIELMKSKAMHRLKGINQHSTLVFYDHKYNISRYEHSVGVMILLKKLNAPLKEQIAGLLHDISHTAFAHVMDKAFGDSRTDDYHEKFYERMLLGSDIPAVLEKHGFDVRDFIDEKKFTLLDKDMPDLCADRLDYFFRDTLVDRGINTYDKFAKHLAIKNKEIVVDSKEAAEELTREFLTTSRNIWTHPLSIAIFEVLAQCFRIAHEKGLLAEDDFLVDDMAMLKKLKSFNNAEINRRLELLNKNFAITFDKEKYDFYKTTKPRQIDPFVLWEGKRVSQFSAEIKKELAEHRKSVDKGHHIKVVGL